MDIIEYVTNLIFKALDKGASDIHIEPQVDGSLYIRIRVDGFLTSLDKVESSYSRAIISRLKVMGDLDIGEQRLPQDGSISFSFKNKSVDLRISTMPTIYGEKIVLRLLKKQDDLLALDFLGLEEKELVTLKKIISFSSGLIIVTGPVGSGKTTTLYALLKFFNKVENNIVTLEDPVEVHLKGINQVQINNKAGLTFACALRFLLRQDPNIIMIGEIRDKETANIAISAAMTGHLVLSTLHTGDSASVITRLLNMGIEPYRLAASLTGVISQRLVRKLCRNCLGKKCSSCNKTGYLGRMGIFEVIATCPLFQQLIVENPTLLSLRTFLKAKGFRTLYEVALAKVASGKTTTEEVHRVIDDV